LKKTLDTTGLDPDDLARALAVLGEVIDTRRPSWAKGQPISPQDAAVKSV